MTNSFSKLFSSLRKEKAVEPESTTEIPTAPINPTAAQAATAKVVDAPVRLEGRFFEAASAQSVGKQREHNEDSVLLINTLIASNGDTTPLGLFIVADGMGGHKHGEVASGLAVRVVANHVLRKIVLSLVSPKPTSPDESMQEILEGALQEAHRVVIKESPGSGTTLTAILLLDKHMTIAHVGDSRAYRVNPDGSLQALTRDHSLVARMVELGQLTDEQAAVHPQRNVLYRALGQGDPFTPDITSSPIPEAGALLICSDGLWGVAPEETLKQIIASQPDLPQACQMMVDAANEAGGPDNISVIAVRLPG